VRVQARVPLPRAEAKDGLDGVHAVAVVPEEAEPGKHEVPLVVEVPGGKAVRVEPDVVTVTIDRK
jgi:YbbR domain-containing protein